MGNSASNSTDGMARKASGKARKNGGANVKDRMMARFGHRKSASHANRTPPDDLAMPSSISDGAGDDFLAVGVDDMVKKAAPIERRPTQLNVKAITVVRPPEPSSRPTSVHGSTFSSNSDDEQRIIKRVSYISQGADSAKDALESGKTKCARCVTLPVCMTVKITKFIIYCNYFFFIICQFCIYYIVF